MGYINFRIGKLKGSGAMGRARAHNQRIAFCENTDAARRFMNKQIMPCAEDYYAFYEKRIDGSKVYQESGRKVRTDAVQALDLEFRVSAEEMHENPFFDLDKFCEETRLWVCNTFGADNVVDMVLHMDEGYGTQNGEQKFAPHIHAIVIPMTKDGRLSASEFIGTPKKLNAMQTSVADQFKDMRLKRGMEKSVAKHNEMKEYYGWVHAARIVDIPEPKERETAQQYAARIKPEIQKAQSQRLNESLMMQRQRDEALTRVRQLEAGINVGEEEVKREREALKRREKEIADREAVLSKDMAALDQWKSVLKGLGDERISEEERKSFLETAKKALDIAREVRENADKEAEIKPRADQNLKGEI